MLTLLAAFQVSTPPSIVMHHDVRVPMADAAARRLGLAVRATAPLGHPVGWEGRNCDLIERPALDRR
jgi:hypothetical protein